MTHVVFSLHLYSFLLLLFCVALLRGETERVHWASAVCRRRPSTTCSASSISPPAPCISTWRSDRSTALAGARRIAQTAVLAIAVAAIVLGYRFALFLITLATT